jgi:hypothetical protein
MVNGGSSVHLKFQREPFKPTEKTVLVPWNDIVVLEDIVMTTTKDSPDSSGELIETRNCPYVNIQPVITTNWISYSNSSSSESLMQSVISVLMTPSSIPVSLERVHLKITLEGILLQKELEADALLRFDYSWNRRNVYRQKVYRVSTAVVSVGYQYSSQCPIKWIKSQIQMPGEAPIKNFFDSSISS